MLSARLLCVHCAPCPSLLQQLALQGHACQGFSFMRNCRCLLEYVVSFVTVMVGAVWTGQLLLVSFRRQLSRLHPCLAVVRLDICVAAHFYWRAFPMQIAYALCWSSTGVFSCPLPKGVSLVWFASALRLHSHFTRDMHPCPHSM